MEVVILGSVLMIVIFVLMTKLSNKDLLIIELQDQSEFRLAKMQERDEQIVDLMHANMLLKLKYDNSIIAAKVWLNQDTMFTERELKTILQYIHPDKTGKDTQQLFMKVNDLKETMK